MIVTCSVAVLSSAQLCRAAGADLSGVVIDHDVVGLDVAVHDAHRVCEIQTLHKFVYVTFSCCTGG